MLRKLYLDLTPFKIRLLLYKIKYNFLLSKLQKKILNYYDTLPPQSVSDEQLEVIEFLKKNRPTNIPYKFQNEYVASDILVYTCSDTGLNYTLLDNKKLYFKRSWTQKQIVQYFNDLLIEQDERSPHRYLTDEFSVDESSIVADIGVAEGNFSLSIIEKIKKLYIFEGDPDWMEALKMTFSPWAHKVTITNMLVGDFVDDSHVTLDAFLMDKESCNFIKVDVDGAEDAVLRGADKLISLKRPLKIALCTYHNQEDEEKFSRQLTLKGFKVEPSRGYMIFTNGGLSNLYEPYLRRGIIRATSK